MLEAKVRRLPVVNAEGRLEGILTMDDVVEPVLLKSTLRENGRTSEDLANTLRNPLRTDSIERQEVRRQSGTSI
jgi:CBS-domain-containing membrane protein